jgi:hypothetical protein
MQNDNLKGDWKLIFLMIVLIIGFFVALYYAKAHGFIIDNPKLL